MQKKSLTLFTVVLSSALNALAFKAEAATVTITTAIDDAWWWEAPTGNYTENDGELRANDINRFNQRLGIRFTDISAVGSIPISSAVLQLYRFEGLNVNNIEAHRITSQWTESSWRPNYDNAVLSSVAVGSPGNTSTGNGWYEWDITSTVQSWLADANSNYGVMLWGTGAGSYQRFQSSDGTWYSDPSNPTAGLAFSPHLVVTTVPLPGAGWLFATALIGLPSSLNRSRRARTLGT